MSDKDTILAVAATMVQLADELQSATRTLPLNPSVIAQFFSELIGAADGSSGAGSDSVIERLQNHTYEKLALGQICFNRLQNVWSKPQLGDGAQFFIESGSTTALAALAMARLWANDSSGGGARSSAQQPRFETNNFLAHLVLHAVCEPRLLYGDRLLHPKYVGYFPVSSVQLENAARQDEAAKKKVAAGYDEMVRDAHRFDRLFMTASRFHLVHGPFVGSQQNAFLKSAFFRGGKTFDVLFDGSKLLSDAVVTAEYQKLHCIQVFDRDSQASARNPCYRVKLVDNALLIPEPTWPDAVNRVLDSGEINLFVSVPCDTHGGAAPEGEELKFNAELETILTSARARLAEFGLTIHENAIQQVGVDPQRYRIAALGTVGSRNVRIKSYSYARIQK